MEIRGRVALVTGAGHRLGREIALALARAGADVVVHYHQAQAQARQTAAEIRALGVRALEASADLAAPGGVQALFDQVEGGLGGLDLLVNSAAIMEPGDVLSVTPEAWQRTLDLNLKAPFFCAQRAARLMRARGGGAIVNIADVGGLEPWSGYPVHSISKAGLIMATRVLARALAPEVRVNAVAPGPVLKPPDWDEARWQALGRRTLLKRPGSGYDVTRTVVFLIENDYITGQVLGVDGGRPGA